MQLCINIYIIITKGVFKRSFLLQTSEIKQLQDMITTMQQQSTLVEEDPTNMNSGYYQRLSSARPLNSAKLSSDMETDVLQSNKLRPISDSKLQSQVLKQVFYQNLCLDWFSCRKKVNVSILYVHLFFKSKQIVCMISKIMKSFYDEC